MTFTARHLYRSIESINSSIAEINVTLTRQQAILEEHIRRTELAEQAIKELKKAIYPLTTQAAAQSLVWKGLAALGAVGGSLVGLWKLLFHR